MASEAKPIIEVKFEKFFPDDYILDRYFQIIRSSRNFAEYDKKQQKSSPSESLDEESEISEEDLDEIDQELEKMLKRMEHEEAKARDALYI